MQILFKKRKKKLQKKRYNPRLLQYPFQNRQKRCKVNFWVNFGMYVFLFIFGGLLITFIIIQWIKASRKLKIDTTTRVINLLSEWTHGHAEGWLIEQTKTPSKLTRVIFYPTDLTAQQKFQEKIEPEVIIAKNIKVIPIGTLS